MTGEMPGEFDEDADRVLVEARSSLNDEQRHDRESSLRASEMEDLEGHSDDPEA